MTTTRSIAVLIGFVVLCIVVGSVAGMVTAPAVIDWYPTLNKPSWNPPAWLFGPVWTTLYVMMAVAAWLVWRQDRAHPLRKTALILFFSQLALNFAWSLLFFGARSVSLGLIDVVMLLTALAITTWAFFRVSTFAGMLMVPYLAWVSFAAALNFTLWRMN
jgi:tryptophan-rich sensory protein